MITALLLLTTVIGSIGSQPLNPVEGDDMPPPWPLMLHLNDRQDVSVETLARQLSAKPLFTNTLKTGDFEDDDDPVSTRLANSVVYMPISSEMETDENESAGRAEKRGLSILARWRPFSSLGRQRTPVRSGMLRSELLGPALSPENDLDIVSAETRAMLRPVGQPLRWG